MRGRSIQEVGFSRAYGIRLSLPSMDISKVTKEMFFKTFEPKTSKISWKYTLQTFRKTFFWPPSGQKWSEISDTDPHPHKLKNLCLLTEKGLAPKRSKCLFCTIQETFDRLEPKIGRKSHWDFLLTANHVWERWNGLVREATGYKQSIPKGKLWSERHLQIQSSTTYNLT